MQAVMPLLCIKLAHVYNTLLFKCMFKTTDMILHNSIQSYIIITVRYDCKSTPSYNFLVLENLNECISE